MNAPVDLINGIELPSRRQPTCKIQQLVALSFGLDPRCMTIRSTDAEHVWPRQVAMYLTRKLTKRSLPAIGAAFGRHHSTVLHAIRAVEARMKVDPMDKADVAALRRALENG
jgi:chromosomal replication initiator protein